MAEVEPDDGAWPGVSIVLTVLNEERHLAEAVHCALGQDYPGPLELVVAVGPSRDATQQIADDLAASDSRITVVANPEGKTPQGLNAAVAASRYPVVARVDGHAMLPQGYLRHAVALLQESGAANVGGVMAAEGVTPFEQAVALAMRSKVGVGSARFHTGGEAGPADTVYLGVFRRSVLTDLGGYDERFVRAQDAELNHRIRQAGGTVLFTPDLEVIYRPRPTVRALALQYRNYGRWRRVLMRTHPDSVRARYLAPPVAVVVIVASLLAAAFGFTAALLLPAAYIAVVVLAAAVVGRRLRASAWALLPVVMVTMHMSWGWGFLTSPRSLVGQLPDVDDV